MLYERLQQLEESGKPIRVGVVGAGDFGTSFICQIAQMKGMEVSIVADINVQNALNAYHLSGFKKEDIVTLDSLSRARGAMDRGKRVIVEDAFILPQCPIDVVVDITGIATFGAFIAYHSILNNKHVVMVNVEADVLAGRILKRLADNAGVVYTLADGDQPALIKELYDWAKTLGLQIVAAGMGSKCIATLEKGVSGSPTKHQIEMASVANMTGLVPDIRGMHEPYATIPEVPQLFSLKEDGGILETTGIVDMVHCRSKDLKTVIEPYLANGVFLVVTSEHSETLKVMSTKSLPMSKNGKNGLIHRPYHLTGVEAPMSVAKAAILKQASGAPIGKPVAEVIAIARRDIKKGEEIDGVVTGENIMGLIERFEIAKEEHLLPLGLAYEVKVKVDVSEGTPISYDMLEEKGNSFAWTLRELQDLEFQPDFRQ